VITVPGYWALTEGSDGLRIAQFDESWSGWNGR